MAQKSGERLRFTQKHPAFGGVEGVEALSCNQVRKSNFFITKTRQKALGLDRVTPTLQRNREKKPPGNEKKAEL